ncbi:MAG: hypothetical protein E7266_06150 [Lachnospiraceae bacterium]|nr:hypothetical protein [Lachnospiraceae bacterium]
MIYNFISSLITYSDIYSGPLKWRAISVRLTNDYLVLYSILTVFFLLLLIFAVFLFIKRTKVSSVILTFLLLIFEILHTVIIFPNSVESITQLVKFTGENDIINRTNIDEIIHYSISIIGISFQMLAYAFLLVTLFLLGIVCILNLFVDDYTVLPWVFPKLAALLSLLFFVFGNLFNGLSKVIYYTVSYIFSSRISAVFEMILRNAVNDCIPTITSLIPFAISTIFLAFGLFVVCNALNRCAHIKNKKVIIHVMED